MKKRLTAYTLMTGITSLVMTGCASNTNRHTPPAPVITPSDIISKQPNQLPSKPINAAPKPSTDAVKKEIIIEPATTQPVLSVEPEPMPTVIQTVTPQETQAIQQKIRLQQQALRKVVVLLPDHPSLGDVNRDIEKGIRAAHQQQPHNNALQLLFIHDALPAEQLLTKAKTFNPDWIIGPLTKADIQAIQTQLDQNQILLNRIDTSTPSVQLGLPIEDETNQILNSFGQNTQPIAVVASNDATEQRILSSLQQQAYKKNIPMLTVSVDKQTADINTWLESEGKLSQSRERIERLSRLLHTKLDTPPQPRRDLQALVLLSNTKQAHNLMAAIQYYQLHWPVLATSRLLPTKKGDKFSEPDFEGIRVLTPPYLISNSPVETPFEALGWDSYQLLGNPNAININGMTGLLELNANNQLVRQLLWQRIQQSKLVPIKQ